MDLINKWCKNWRKGRRWKDWDDDCLFTKPEK